MPVASAKALLKRKLDQKNRMRAIRKNIKAQPQKYKKQLKADRERKQKKGTLKDRKIEDLGKQLEQQIKNNYCLLARIKRGQDRQQRGWDEAKKERARVDRFKDWWLSVPQKVRQWVLREGVLANERKGVWSVAKKRYVTPEKWDPSYNGEGRWL